MSGRIELLQQSLSRGFDRKARHGPNLRGSLRGVGPQEAAWRPHPARHNIWEITVHAAYWKYAVWRRITGRKRGSFTLGGSNWFVRPGQTTTKAWKEDLSLLEQWHRRQFEVVTGLTEKDLDRKRGESSVLDMAEGIAFHDVYHAGQIQLLKRMYGEQRGGKPSARPG